MSCRSDFGGKAAKIEQVSSRSVEQEKEAEPSPPSRCNLRQARSPAVCFLLSDRSDMLDGRKKKVCPRPDGARHSLRIRAAGGYTFPWKSSNGTGEMTLVAMLDRWDEIRL